MTCATSSPFHNRRPGAFPLKAGHCCQVRLSTSLSSRGVLSRNVQCCVPAIKRGGTWRIQREREERFLQHGMSDRCLLEKSGPLCVLSFDGTLSDHLKHARLSDWATRILRLCFSGYKLVTDATE